MDPVVYPHVKNCSADRKLVEEFRCPLGTSAPNQSCAALQPGWAALFFRTMSRWLTKMNQMKSTIVKPFIDTDGRSVEKPPVIHVIRLCCVSILSK